VRPGLEATRRIKKLRDVGKSGHGSGTETGGVRRKGMNYAKNQPKNLLRLQRTKRGQPEKQSTSKNDLLLKWEVGREEEGGTRAPPAGEELETLKIPHCKRAVMSPTNFVKGRFGASPRRDRGRKDEGKKAG